MSLPGLRRRAVQLQERGGAHDAVADRTRGAEQHRIRGDDFLEQQVSVFQSEHWQPAAREGHWHDAAGREAHGRRQDVCQIQPRGHERVVWHVDPPAAGASAVQRHVVIVPRRSAGLL